MLTSKRPFMSQISNQRRSYFRRGLTEIVSAPSHFFTAHLLRVDFSENPAMKWCAGIFVAACLAIFQFSPSALSRARKDGNVRHLDGTAHSHLARIQTRNCPASYSGPESQP